jgi:hypothetical protein
VFCGWSEVQAAESIQDEIQAEVQAEI